MSSKNTMLLFICDRRECEKCNPDCYYTLNIRHAKNFQLTPGGDFMEVDE